MKLNVLRAKQQQQKTTSTKESSIQTSKTSMPESSMQLYEDLLKLKKGLPVMMREALGKANLSRIISLLPRTNSECREALIGPVDVSKDILDEIITLVKKHKGPDLKTDPLDVITF